MISLLPRSLQDLVDKTTEQVVAALIIVGAEQVSHKQIAELVISEIGQGHDDRIRNSLNKLVESNQIQKVGWGKYRVS